MTFHLELMARGAPNEALEILEASLLSEGWYRTGDGARLRYHNPDTGVAASIERADGAAISGRFESTGQVFTLNYGHPSWFALETIPAFARAAGRAELLVMDPQTADDKPVEPDADALIESWSRGNQAAIAAAEAAGLGPRTMSPSASMAWWRHQRALPSLRARFAAVHYVPSLHLLAFPGHRSVQRAMSWPDVVPALIPDCDAFLFLRSSPPAGFEIAGLAQHEAVRSRIDDLLVWASVEVGDATYAISVLTPNRAAAAANRLSSIALTQVTDAFQMLSAEDVVDALGGGSQGSV